MKKLYAILLALALTLSLAACGSSSGGDAQQSGGNDAQQSSDAGSGSGDGLYFKRRAHLWWKYKGRVMYAYRSGSFKILCHGIWNHACYEDRVYRIWHGKEGF